MPIQVWQVILCECSFAGLAIHHTTINAQAGLHGVSHRYTLWVPFAPSLHVLTASSVSKLQAALCWRDCKLCIFGPWGKTAEKTQKEVLSAQPHTHARGNMDWSGCGQGWSSFGKAAGTLQDCNGWLVRQSMPTQVMQIWLFDKTPAPMPKNRPQKGNRPGRVKTRVHLPRTICSLCRASMTVGPPPRAPAIRRPLHSRERMAGGNTKQSLQYKQRKWRVERGGQESRWVSVQSASQ